MNSENVNINEQALKLIAELKEIEFGEYSKLNNIYGRTKILLTKSKYLKERYLHELLTIKTQYKVSKKGNFILESFREGYHWKEVIQMMKNILEFVKDETEFANNKVIIDENAMDIFISHSKHDVGSAKLLIDLIKSALNVTSNRIRCTSVNGYRLSAGASTNEQLRKEVHDSKVLIGLISEKGIESAYVLFELGARWGASLTLKPLLISKSGPDLLKGPLSEINALNSCDAAQLHQLIDELAEELHVQKEPTSVYQEKIEALVKNSLEKSLPQTIISGKKEDIQVQDLEDTDTKIKVFCDREWPDDYSMKVHCINEQKEAAAKMKEPRPNDIPENVYINIVMKAEQEWPDDYTMQVHIRDEQIEAYRELLNM